MEWCLVKQRTNAFNSKTKRLKIPKILSHLKPKECFTFHDIIAKEMEA